MIVAVDVPGIIASPASVLTWLALASAALASLPAVMVVRNLRAFVPPPNRTESHSVPPPPTSPSSKTEYHCVLPATARPRLSVLIPARDEAAGISRTMKAALHSEEVDVEVVVLDDHSTDATPDIVLAVSQRDTRVRLIRGRPLPAGWNGKQYACGQLASAAEHPTLVFLDADVRLAPDALRRLFEQRQRTGVALLSAFPHQETETLMERLLIPMMHFILLGFLPISRMRRSTHPAYAAGCGQLFITSRSEYESAGGHAAIRSSRHDGIMLPRAYRRAGLSTDICDGTAIASCRMYHSARGVTRGLLKNATEGIANARLIMPFTIVLLGGSVLPFALLPVALWAGNAWAIGVTLVACLLAWLPRWICAVRFSQSKLGALLHPVAVLLFVALQWQSLFYQWTGKPTAWKGREGGRKDEG